MPVLPIVLPHRGALLSFGSFFSNASTWYLLDLEHAQASRIEAHVDRTAKQFALIVDKRIDRALLPAELARVVVVLNRIWSAPLGPSKERFHDAVWDLWLLDGDDVRQDAGPGSPHGPAGELATALHQLVGPELAVMTAAPGESSS